VKNSLRAAFCALFLAGLGSVQGAIVTFDDLPLFGTPFSYSSQGFNFTITTVGDPGNDHFHSDGPGDNGTVLLGEHSGCCSNSAIITSGNGLFSLISLHVDLFGSADGFSRFVTNNGDVAIVTGADRLTTFFFPATFQNVSSVEWFTDSGLVYIDDVNLADAVPEPGSLTLFAGGLLVLAWKARRRHLCDY
jgi:hypothetical protein